MEKLKTLIRMKNIPKWKIGDVIGVSEGTIHRWLRKYDAERYQKIMNAIKQIEGENDA